MKQNFLVLTGPKRSFRIVPEDSDVRLLLAAGFSTLFALTILIALVLPFWPGRDSAATWTTLKEVLSVLLPAETGLLGSILGFYFGSKASAPIVETAPGEQLPKLE
jgi:membrane protein YqaA with SNARE-associated domain